MTLTKAVEIINEMEDYVKIALRRLQEQKFQQAIEVGYRFIFCDMENYKAAISLLIECDRTDLLERCRKIYELACEAEPLLDRAYFNYEKSGKGDEKTGLYGTAWPALIKNFWKNVVLPILQTDAEAVVSPTLQTNAEDPQRGKKGDEKAEAPHRGRPKDDSILWLVGNPDGHLGVLHQLTDGLRGVKFFCFIKAAVLEGWFDKPPYRALEKEFGNRGVKSCYSKCMSDNNAKELEPLRETLRSRYQKL